SCFSVESGSKRRRRNSSRISKNYSVGAPGGGSESYRWARVRSVRKEEDQFHEQALAAAVLFQRQMQIRGGGGVPSFDRSSSLRYPSANSVKNQALPRSSSSRPRSVTDPLLQPHQLVNQDVMVDKLETNHFVLVHGGGFGAWCWYKTIALLEEGGFRVSAVDLTGSGIHSFDTNSITSLAHYVKPLTDLLGKLNDGEKVILVGHDFGGACISYAMELHPSKVSKAIFLAAAMLASGQCALDVFSKKVESNELMRRSQ
ncbi:hypothetical protein M569_11432, partial [Genlisea aurea]